MKTLIFAFSLVLSQTLFANSKLLKIWPQVYIGQSADLDQIDELLSTSRDEVRRKLIDDTVALIMHKQPVEIAAAVVLEFDQVYRRHRMQALQYMSTNFKDLILAMMERGHHHFDIQNRRLYFMSHHDTNELLTLSYAKKFKFIKDEHLYDILLYGNYNVQNKHSYRLTLHAFNIKTGKINTFTATGKPERITASIIKQMFNVYYSADVPHRVKGENFSIVYHETNSISSRRKAKKKCQKLKARLASRDEIDAIDLIGPYNGTINLITPAYYILKEQRLDDTYGKYQSDFFKLGNYYIAASNSTELKKLLQPLVYKEPHEAYKLFICVK